MLEKRFKKNTEDFVCENCGREVKGSGYTNHCPACLWSKHVDVNPGDRAEQCGGMMPPVDLVQEKGEHIIVNRCVKCSKEKRNRLAKDDDFDVALEVLRKKNARV
jgi:hypothetical protein